MTRIPLPMHPTRKRMTAAVADEYRRIRTELAPQLSQMPDAEQRAVNVAQNVLRDCLTALLSEMAPYSQVTPIEMARRAASYALSIVPIEDQDAAVAAMLDGFADFHQYRTASGVVITAQWKMDDGSIAPNFPELKGQK